MPNNTTRKRVAQNYMEYGSEFKSIVVEPASTNFSSVTASLGAENLAIAFASIDRMRSIQ
jgi:hypothetical protein